MYMSSLCLWRPFGLDGHLYHKFNVALLILLLHHSSRRFGAFLIALSVITVPFRIGFDALPEGGWVVVDWVTDCTFAVDIVLNFRMAYVNGHVLVTSPSLMASHYLRGWFTTDLLSTVPFDRQARQRRGRVVWRPIRSKSRYIVLPRSLFVVLGYDTRCGKYTCVGGMLLRGPPRESTHMYAYVPLMRHAFSMHWPALIFASCIQSTATTGSNTCIRGDRLSYDFVHSFLLFRRRGKPTLDMVPWVYRTIFRTAQLTKWRSPLLLLSHRTADNIYDRIMSLAGDENSRVFRSLKLVKVVRIVRLLRLFRLFKMARFRIITEEFMEVRRCLCRRSHIVAFVVAIAEIGEATFLFPGVCCRGLVAAALDEVLCSLFGCLCCAL